MFVACEPNLAKLPVTLTIPTDAELRNGGLWTIGLLFVAAPAFIGLWLLLRVIAALPLGPESSDAIWIWSTIILMFCALAFGLHECYALWQMKGLYRTVTFDVNSIEAIENDRAGQRRWQEPCGAFLGIVLSVDQRELPEHSRQLVALRHNDSDRSILLHKSKGNGLDPIIQDRARLWAKQLKLPVFVENASGNLIAID